MATWYLQISRGFKGFLAILDNELNGAMWHPEKWQNF
jgi:hypothetical protein